MGELPHSIDLDLREAKAMLDGLVPYIYEDDLYGKIGMNMPRLTPGALLLRMTRLERLHSRMTDSQLRAYHAAHSQFTRLTTEWNQAYRKKLGQEATARLRDLQTYLGECKDDERGCAANYLPEALRRTILHEIGGVLSADELGEAATTLKGVDRSLRAYVRPCPFLWDEALAEVYPEGDYWWLYQRPPQPSKDKEQ
jgi:hypothetical protein